MSIGTAQHIYYQAKEKAGITHGRGIHTLRHCFEGLTICSLSASHLLENGAELFVIKRWLGHTAIKTTCTYLHLSPDYLAKISSPLDQLYTSGAQA